MLFPKIKSQSIKTDGDYSLYNIPEHLMELELECKNITGFFIAEDARDEFGFKKLTLKNINEVNAKAFKNCHALRTAQLDCVKIGGSAFRDCYSLTELTLVNTEQIGEKAFMNCRSLKEITLPDTLEFIGDRAFVNSAIKELTVPPGVKELGSSLIHGGIIKIFSDNGVLPKPAESLLNTAHGLGSITVYSLRTGKQLYSLDFGDYFRSLLNALYKSDLMLENIENHLDELFPGGIAAALDKARGVLKNKDPEITSDALDLLKSYISDMTALEVYRIIQQKNTKKLSEFQYFKDIQKERFCEIADYSVNTKNTEVTAVLLKKFNEIR